MFATTFGFDEHKIHRLWDELSDYDASQSQAALAWLMTTLTDLGNLKNATWAGATRMNGGDPLDPLRGWRVAASEALHPVPLQSEEGHLAGVMRLWDRREIDPSFLLPLQDVGKFRTYSLRRGLPSDWFDTPFYHRHYGAFNVYDLVLIAFPLNGDCESHFGFYASAPISEETIMRLAYALRGIKWFHRYLMLSHGLLMADAPLTPSERKVLPLLLSDASEKHIAQQLGLGNSATHRHVTAIFRKFGVRSRPGLISLWLSRPGGSLPPDT